MPYLILINSRIHIYYTKKQPPKVIQKKKAILKNFALFTGPEGLEFHWKEIPTQVFSCEYCKIFNNTYFEEHLRTAASVHRTSHGCGILVYVADSISYRDITSSDFEWWLNFEMSSHSLERFCQIFNLDILI